MKSVIGSGVFWTAIGSISTAVMAVLTYFMFRHNKKEFIAINKANLQFSIVEHKNCYLLRVSNVGRIRADNVVLKVTSPLIDDNYFTSVKNTFASLPNRPFVLEAGKNKNFLLCEMHISKPDDTTIQAGAEFIDGRKANLWLDKHINDIIHINGRYGKKSKIDQTISISQFFVKGAALVIEDCDKSE